MRILIAEDEPDISSLYKIALEERNHQVTIVQDGEECIKLYIAEVQNQNGVLVGEPSFGSNEFETSKNKYKQQKYDSYTKGYNNDSFPPSQNVSTQHPPFDAVVLDYRMPKKDGLEVAKEILKLYPEQRIIFASAYIKESLEDCVKELDQIVELMQKPFMPETLVDTIEDREVSLGLEKLMSNLKAMKDQRTEPTLEQITDLLEGLRRIQKGRTF
jgi:CheY-like chemotaxis protein